MFTKPSVRLVLSKAVSSSLSAPLLLSERKPVNSSSGSSQNRLGVLGASSVDAPVLRGCLRLLVHLLRWTVQRNYISYTYIIYAHTSRLPSYPAGHRPAGIRRSTFAVCPNTGPSCRLASVWREARFVRRLDGRKPFRRRRSTSTVSLSQRKEREALPIEWRQCQKREGAVLRPEKVGK